MKQLQEEINEFTVLKNYPFVINCIGNTKLLKNRKISIVGSRRPSAYTQALTSELSSKLSLRGITIVSGAAMGVDSLAHNATYDFNTIAVMANGLNIRYPSVNTSLIKNIEQKGLCLSAYAKDEKARAYTFVQRNELVVALGEVLIITQAELNSGSLRSYEFAQKQNKKVFVLAHRIGESLGTQNLIIQNKAEVIYDIDDFVNRYKVKKDNIDEILLFCKYGINIQLALDKFGNKIYEYELEGKIYSRNGIIYPK